MQCSEGFGYWIVNSNEAVPVALILNELLSNAAKHADPQNPCLTLTGLFVPGRQCLEICISNRMSDDLQRQGVVQSGSGLQLVTSLMPREGATLSTKRSDGMFESRLELTAPVVAERSVH